jgi:hypothetical protein
MMVLLGALIIVGVTDNASDALVPASEGCTVDDPTDVIGLPHELVPPL